MSNGAGAGLASLAIAGATDALQTREEPSKAFG
jgi:hypothetical protein